MCTALCMCQTFLSVCNLLHFPFVTVKATLPMFTVILLRVFMKEKQTLSVSMTIHVFEFHEDGSAVANFG